MTDVNASFGRLHYELIRSLVESAAIPPDDELQARLGCSPAELDRAFDALAESHGVVLHPSSRRVWAIHPFSLAPTTFLAESGEKMWWGNCAWCSLGIASLVGGTCVITTTLGAEKRQMQLSVANNQVSPSDLVVHLPIPMTRAWDNVVYTCSTMLMFEDEEQVTQWCVRHRIARGDVQPVTKVLELARRWYGKHLAPDWRKHTVTEAREIFLELGLTHPVWQLPSRGGQF